MRLLRCHACCSVWKHCGESNDRPGAKEGDFTWEKKELKKKTSFFPGAYWCVVTAVFLAVGFRTEDWEWAAMIWPIAALLFVALLGIVNCVAGGRLKKEKET